MNYKDTFVKFLKFGAVGVSGTAVDFGVTFICKEFFGWNKYVSNSIGFMVAVTTNFILNRKFTFKSKGNLMPQYIKFVLIGLVGMGLNNLIIYLLDQEFGTNFYVAKVIATLFVMIWNFFANLLITFK